MPIHRDHQEYTNPTDTDTNYDFILSIGRMPCIVLVPPRYLSSLLGMKREHRTFCSAKLNVDANIRLQSRMNLYHYRDNLYCINLFDCALL